MELEAQLCVGQAESVSRPLLDEVFELLAGPCRCLHLAAEDLFPSPLC